MTAVFGSAELRHVAIQVALASLLTMSRVGVVWGQFSYSLTSGPFNCRSEFPLGDYSDLLSDLSQIQVELEQVLHVRKPREQVDIWIFGGEAAYRKWMKSSLPNVAFRRAMYVKTAGRGAVYTFRGPEMAVDLRHEATHGLLHAALPMVPLWLDEGLAEYFEMPVGQRAGGNPNQKAILRNIRFGMTPSLIRLENKRELSELSAADYRDAWAWVHFMLQGPPEARQELIAYLDDIHAGTPPGLLSRRLQARLGGLDQPLAVHFKSWSR